MHAVDTLNELKKEVFRIISFLADSIASVNRAKLFCL